MGAVALAYLFFIGVAIGALVVASIATLLSALILDRRDRRVLPSHNLYCQRAAGRYWAEVQAALPTDIRTSQRENP
jgi:hypothetical protein